MVIVAGMNLITKHQNHERTKDSERVYPIR